MSPMSIDEERSESKISVIPGLFSNPPTPDMYYDDDTPPSPALSTRTTLTVKEAAPDDNDDDETGNIPGTPVPGTPRSVVPTDDVPDDLEGSHVSVRSGSALIAKETSQSRTGNDGDGDAIGDPAHAPDEQEKKKKKKKKKKSGHNSPKLD